MASSSKKSPKLLGVGKWRFSWRRLVVMASLALNLAFLTFFLALAFTNVMDGVFMDVGLSRYCSYNNDDKFKDSGPKVVALRDYVCDRNLAHPYFKDGFNKFLDSKNLSH